MAFAGGRVGFDGEENGVGLRYTNTLKYRVIVLMVSSFTWRNSHPALPSPPMINNISQGVHWITPHHIPAIELYHNPHAKDT